VIISIACFLFGFPAVVRATRILTEDEIALPYRQWVVRKWGRESKIAYWAHCPWCTSIWVGAPFMALAVFWPTKGLLAFFAMLSASLISGLILGRE
jgi:hypothetical protein